MDCGAARQHMDRRLAGSLESALVKELDAHIESCSECAKEYNIRKEEEELFGQALSELKPSKSVKVRLADVCSNIAGKATNVADFLSERSWRWIRWVYAALFVTMHIVLVLAFRNQYGGFFGHHAEEIDEKVIGYYANLIFAAVAWFLTMFGKTIGEANAFLGGGFTRLGKPASNLEILIIYLLGMLGLLITLGIHYAFWIRYL